MTFVVKSGICIFLLESLKFVAIGLYRNHQIDDNEKKNPREKWNFMQWNV